MITRRAIGPSGRQARRTIALCVLALPVILAGCRGASAPEEPTAPARLVFAAGDTLVYDGWALNAWGFAIDSTKTQETWAVLQTGASAGGSTDAIMIRATTVSLRTGATAADTFYLRVTENGALLQYRFLADLVWRREQRRIPPRWDTLAVLESPLWTVGVLDSAGQQKVTGSVPVMDEYFQVNVNGVPSVITARRIEMQHELFSVDLWLSIDPPCFPRIEEAPDPLEDVPRGSLHILRKASPAPR